MSQQPSFARTAPVFFQRLREVTESYFKENNISKTGDYRLYLKTGILLVALAALYAVLVFFTPAAWWVSLLLCAVMGVVVASVGFNVMHDGAHGSYSRRKWVNEAMAHSLNLLGGNAYLWKLKHNENHHTFTNVEGMDDDIDIKPWIRVHEGQKRYWFHRFQHIYSLFLYGTTYLFWIFFNDLRKYFTSKVADGTPMRPMGIKDHLVFWGSKLFYIGLFIVLPMLKLGVLPVLAGYGVMVFVAGVVISVVFQLAHVVEHAEFVHPPSDGHLIESEWAVHQVETTANFATRNRIWNWLFGGLNFQIEHHLFPRISHVHYPALSVRLRQVCAEFGVEYREFPTLRSALRSHLAHLRRVGMA
ncbi:MAG: acyl-CoA desaturase [Flavobacteriales bacterium]|nr:acyl-CoA desaturase [Flavobacteriales bacterium]